MIKMCFSDNSNNSGIVNMFKQLLKRETIKNFSLVYRKWVHSQMICFI